MIDTIEPGQPATIEVPFQLRRRGVEIRLVLRAEGAETPDDKLVALVARSHRWLDQLTSGAIASIREIAQAEGIDGGDVSRFLPLAFLAPEIVEALPAPSPAPASAGPHAAASRTSSTWSTISRPNSVPDARAAPQTSSSDATSSSSTNSAICPSPRPAGSSCSTS